MTRRHPDSLGLRYRTLSLVLILSPAYDLEDNVPIANIEAFFAACRAAPKRQS